MLFVSSNSQVFANLYSIREEISTFLDPIIPLDVYKIMFSY